MIDFGDVAMSQGDPQILLAEDAVPGELSTPQDEEFLSGSGSSSQFTSLDQSPARDGHTSGYFVGTTVVITAFHVTGESTSFRCPTAPVDLVPRPSPLATLDHGDDRALTVICAPPGYGKTLLLADWVRDRISVRPAWVNVEEDEDDSRRLWGSILSALCACPVAFFAELVDEIDALPTRLRLVLDDAHNLVTGYNASGFRTDPLQGIARARGPPPETISAPYGHTGDPRAPLGRWS